MSGPHDPEPYCAIRGLGYHIPEEKLTNADLEKLVETDDAWIVKRTGIRSRRKLPDNETTSDLAVRACIAACEDAGVPLSDIDLLLCATATPDRPLPATACYVQAKLGLEGVTAMDINAACSGFTYSMSLAAGQVRSGMAKRVLVVGAEAMTRFLDYSDRAVCILFGDAAAAAVVASGDEGRYRMVYSSSGADGRVADMITIPGGGSIEPASPGTLDARRHFVHMQGRDVFKSAVRQMTDSTLEALKALNQPMDEKVWFVPHQANVRILKSVVDNLGMSEDRAIYDMEDVGNTTAASIPLAFARAQERGCFRTGDLVLTVSYGAGATWSTQAYRVH